MSHRIIRSFMLILLPVLLLANLTSPALATPSFTEISGTSNPFNNVAGYHSLLALGDLDGDGDLDILSGGPNGAVYFYRNVGTATAPSFSEETSPFDGVDVGDIAAPALGDLDGDGDLDALIGEWDGVINFYRNTGTATTPNFSAVTGSGNPFNGIYVSNGCSAPTLGDLDGDGDLDALVGTYGGYIRFYRNVGTAAAPSFSLESSSFDDVTVGGLSIPTLGDLDRDGDLDVLIGERDGVINFYRNTGTATTPSFSAVTGSGNPFNGVDVGEDSSPILADVDADGDLDVPMGGLFTYLKFYRNGDTATTPTLRLETGTLFDGVDVGTGSMPTLADIDGDGDLDAFIGESDGILNFYRNTGTVITGVFSEVTGTANPFNGVDVGFNSSPTLADVDGDGDLDALIGESGGTIAFYRNTGTILTPTFSLEAGIGTPFNSVDVGSSSCLTLGDLDGDGDLDALIGESGGTIRFYRNTGTAITPTFSRETDTLFNGVDVGDYSVPTLADVDSDGDLDAFIGKQDGAIAFYRNTGTATAPSFSVVTGTDAPFNGVDVGDYSAPILADLDGDSDLDAFIGEYDGTIAFYRNALPEMAVIGNGQVIADGDTTPSTGDHTDFGGAILADSITRTFTISNNGTGALNLTGSPLVSLSGTGAGDFSVVAQPTSTVSANTATTFQVRFIPSVTGARAATITIANDDPDEAPYNFAIQGTGQAPEIAIIGNDQVITDGDTTPSTDDYTDFGTVALGAKLSRTFTISNSGTSDLNLTGTLMVSFSGAAAGDFDVVAAPMPPVGAGLTTDFRVRFAPTAMGIRSAIMSIANNDPDEDPYNFIIQGIGCGGTTAVTNANDSGTGSLRQAIFDACDNGTINFATNTSIYLTSTLTITRNLTIDGTGRTVKISGDTNNDGSRNVRVFEIQNSGVATLTHLSIVSGTAPYGGGIYNAGTLVLQYSTLAGNSATSYGGGIYNNWGTLSVQNSTLSGNSASSGGGITDAAGTVTVQNSTLSGNSAATSGGGIIGSGGTLTLQNSTFSDNSAATGGGIYNYSDGTLSLYNTLVANSTSGGDCYNRGTIAANDHTLIEDGSCSPTLSGDPNLSALQDNGGSTWTHALLPGSTAIDAGASCLSTDQRSVSRPQPSSGACDIGAFESQGFTLTYGGGSGQSTLVNTAFATPLTLTVSSSAGEPVDGGQVIFTAPTSGASLSSNPLTVTISGGTVSHAVTANGVGGSYTVVATTRGALGSAVGYALTHTAPEMALIAGGLTIVDGDTTPYIADRTDFGSTALGGTIYRTYTISNSGDGNLILSGSPVISITGAGASDFGMVSLSTAVIGPKATALLQLRFTPSVAATQVTTVTIANNDANENPYDFAIQGTGLASDLTLSKSVTPVTAMPGQVVTYTLTFTNQGNTSAGSVVLTDAVPISITNLSVISSNVAITATTPVYTWQVQSLTAGQSGTVILTGQVSPTLSWSGEAANTAGIAGTVVETTLANNVATASLDITLPTVTFDAAAYSVTEAGGPAVITLSLSSALDVPATVQVSSSDGSATAGSDYSVVDQTVTLPAGQTAVTFTVAITDDAVMEDDEALTLTLQAPVAAQLGVPAAAVLTITDDDCPGVVVSPTSLTLAEPDGSASFDLRLATQPTATVTIELVSSDVSECSVPTSVDITPETWQTGVTVTVSAVDDDLEDGSQPCTIQTAATSSDPAYAGIAVEDVAVTVTDDDGILYLYLPAVFMNLNN